MNSLRKGFSIILAIMLAISLTTVGCVAAADGTDLTVTTVAANASTVYDGDFVTVYAIVRNLGDTGVSAGVNVDFMVDNSLLQTVKTSDAVNAGGMSVVNSTIYWNPYFGTHKITAIINSEKTVVETDYANNRFGTRTVVLDEANPSPTIPTDNTVTQIAFSPSSVTLSNAENQIINAANASNISVTDNTYVEIKSEGAYTITGACDNGGINVNVDKTAYPESVVELSLAGLDLTSTSTSPIYVSSIGDECAISVKSGTVNTITDSENYTNADGDSAAIYSMDDLKIKGKGTLTVNGNCHYGICSKDDLKLWNSTLTVNATDVGIKGKDSVRIGDPDDLTVNGAYDNLKITVNATTGDGIKATNTEDETKGYITINGGTIDINSYADAISAVRDVTITGGTTDCYTYTGAGDVQTGGGMQPGPGQRPGQTSAATTDVSAKAIKCGDSDLSIAGTINVLGGTIIADSTDDSIHATGAVNISNGSITAKSGDDAIHSDTVLTVSGNANINIPQSYEGLEATDIEITGGSVSLTSSDDGINAAGGNDASGNTNPGWQQGGMSSSSGTLNISGGYVFVRASGDGVDSNGNLTISGGTVIVCGPTSGGNGIFDKGDGGYTFSISNATVFGIGTSDMFVTPSGISFLKVSSALNANTLLTIADANGNVLSALKVPADMNMNGTLFYCSPNYNASSYSLYKGGTYSGTLNENGYGTGGTVSGASQG